MQINHARKQVKRSTGLRSSDGLTFKTDRAIATKLLNIKDDFFTKYDLLKSELERSLTMDEVKSILDTPKEKEVENFQITVLVDKFIEAKENIYSGSRISSYNRLKTLITDFTNDKPFTDDYKALNKTWVLSLIDYLAYELEYSNTSIESNLKAIRAVLNFYDIPTRFKMKEVMLGMRGDKINNEIPFLTLDYLDKIWELEYKMDMKTEDVQMLFLFCCYTGIRFSESQIITKDNVSVIDGVTVLTHTPSKNAKTVQVPLNGRCKTILEIYGTPPKMSNAKANKTLHKILKDCGFTKIIQTVHYKGKNRIEKSTPLHDLLTFHDSRKSFGCNLIEGGLDMQSTSDLMGISLSTLMKWYSKSNKQERNIKALSILNR